MPSFEWTQVGDEWHADTRYGTAIITEQEGIYTWRLEQPTQGILMHADGAGIGPPYLSSFEEADEFILLTLAFLSEPPTPNPDDSQSWRFDHRGDKAGQRYSLALGEAALPADLDEVHLTRLALIKVILFEEIDPAEEASDDTFWPEPLKEGPALQWQTVGAELRSETLFGTAIIVPQEDHWRWRIEHPSGAILPVGFEGYDYFDQITCASREKAQDVVADQIGRLLNPLIPRRDIRTRLSAEIDYPYLAFALAICAQALPPGTDPVHRERFELIKSDLFLTLD